MKVRELYPGIRSPHNSGEIWITRGRAPMVDGQAGNRVNKKSIYQGNMFIADFSGKDLTHTGGTGERQVSISTGKNEVEENGI